MGPPPVVAEVRNAVRGCLADLDPGSLVLVACSGGADSLALAAAVAFVAPRLRLRAGGVTVDHGLQPGSAERAAEVADVLRGLRLDPVEQVAVAVPPPAGHGGPEAAARAARYAALTAVAARAGAAAVLLGHTMDDQAETVLLGLARGSGGRSLAGMPARQGLYRRPLLSVRRSVTRAAALAAGLRPWEDPHNADVRYARARVRHRVMPVLEAALGPGVVEALARTAEMLRVDAEYLDGLAQATADRMVAAGGVTSRGDAPASDARPTPEERPVVPPTGTVLPVDAVAGLPAAIRTRVLRAAALAAGCPASSLAACHVAQLDALVHRWRGQRWVDLPGGVRVRRSAGGLRFDGSAGARADRGGTGRSPPTAADTPAGRGFDDDTEDAGGRR